MDGNTLAGNDLENFVKVILHVFLIFAEKISKSCLLELLTRLPILKLRRSVVANDVVDVSWLWAMSIFK